MKIFIHVIWLRIYLEPAINVNEQNSDDSHPFIMSLQAFATSETRPKYHRAETKLSLLYSPQISDSKNL